MEKSEAVSDRFFDGCHRYGWILGPLLSAAMTLAMFAYYVGGLEEKVSGIKDEMTQGFVNFNQRVTRIETQMDKEIH
jgi:hypothetical protein